MDQELQQSILAQKSENATMSGHPVVDAVTRLITAHNAVMHNGSPIDVLRNAQAGLAVALTKWERELTSQI